MSIEQTMESYRQTWNAEHALGDAFVFDGDLVKTVTPGYLRRYILVVNIERTVPDADGTKQITQTVAVETLKPAP